MPSKTSKQRNTLSLWKAAQNCSESELEKIAHQLALEIQRGDRLFLEGPMGVGKTTFARSLLAGLGVHQPPEGSPTFAIAHEYHSDRGEIVHIDFYRIKNEQEIEDAGISSYYWERPLIVISEWISSWPEFRDQVLRTGKTWLVTLSMNEENLQTRNIEILVKSKMRG